MKKNREMQPDCNLIFWMWNEQPDPAMIRRQMKNLKNAGIGGFFIHAMPEEFRAESFPDGLPGYLSDEWFKQIARTVRIAARLKMKLWLYDEGGWPSGTVNGQLVAQHPELAAIQIKRSEDGCSLEKTYHPNRPDLLRPETTRLFIEMTHERYFQTVGKEFGRTIPGIFTDEPWFGYFDPETEGIPWSEALPVEFEHLFHYPCEDAVQQIFSGDSEAAHSASRDYRIALTRLAVRNYFEPLHRWCRRRGLLFTGHLSGDDMPDVMFPLHGDVFEIFRCFDIPGLDAIWRQIHPDSPETDFPKYVVSAARRAGKHRVLSESYAVYGYDCSFDEMRKTADRQYICGVTDIVPMAASYSTRDSRQIGTCCNLFPPDPRWQFYSGFAGYTERMRQFLAAGRSQADIAVLLPFSSWDRLAPAPASDISVLARRRLAYDYLGELELMRAVRSGSALKCGRCRYKVLVLPENIRLDASLEARIQEWRKNGLPVLFSNEAEKAAQWAQTDLQIDPDSGQLRVLKLKTGRKTGYFLLNASAEKLVCRCHPEDNKNWEWYDAVTGISTPAELDPDGTLLLKLPAHGSLILRESCRFRRGKTSCGKRIALPLSGTWLAKTVSRAVWTSEGFSCAETNDSPPGSVPAVIEFTNTFLLNEKCHDRQFSFELPECVCGMWIIRINGREAGRAPWTPWKFNLTAHLRRGENRITCLLFLTAGPLYRTPEVRNELKKRGWANEYFDIVSQYPLRRIPDAARLPDSVIVEPPA